MGIDIGSDLRDWIKGGPLEKCKGYGNDSGATCSGASSSTQYGQPLGPNKVSPIVEPTCQPSFDSGLSPGAACSSQPFQADTSTAVACAPLKTEQPWCAMAGETCAPESLDAFTGKGLCHTQFDEAKEAPAATAEKPGARWADIADSSDESEPGTAATAGTPAKAQKEEAATGPVAAAAEKPRGEGRRWADITDSSDESEPGTKTWAKVPGQEQPKARWADLADTPTATEEATTVGREPAEEETKVPAPASPAHPQRNTHARSRGHRGGGRKDKERRAADGKAPLPEGRGTEGQKSSGLPTKEAYSQPERQGAGESWAAVARPRERKGAAKMMSQPLPSDSRNGQWQRTQTAAAGKRQCQFIIGIEEDSKFGVVRRVLGSRGANMKAIAEPTGAKLRLRGRGSKFLEGPEQCESEDPLMLCVSVQDQKAYNEAVKLISDLLEDIYSEYRSFCNGSRRPVPDLRIQMHEGAREGAR